jgi:hypothetical protein
MPGLSVKMGVMAGKHLHDPGEKDRGLCIVWEPTAPAIKDVLVRYRSLDNSSMPVKRYLLVQ